jgi:SAM-dependent methyltransferase
MLLSGYYNDKVIEAKVKAGQHRDAVGGLWEEIGQLQLEFLVSSGLNPKDRVLDIGCGCLRGGVKLVRYLDSSNYFGTDLNEALLEAGYAEIAKEALTEKLPRSQLVRDGDFNFSWSEKPFDVALAQSVFTHLPLNHIRICLERLASVIRSRGRFYMTFFEIPADHPTYQPYRQMPGGVITNGANDPYHYRFSDLEYFASGLPWTCRYIGDWGHPRGQRMVEYTRL